ncbi:MAG: energy transducer TonB [Polaromonas sp.]|nr:energy transducer TonB [Polaromonas sp.]
MNAACSSTLSPSPNAARLPLTRNVVIVLVVVALHAGFIWALQSGLMRNTTELLVPAEVLAQIIDPPAPRTEPAAPAPATPVARKSAVAKIAARPQKQPLAIADPMPSPNAPSGVVTLPEPALPAAVAAAPAMPAGPPAAAVVQLPSSNADYLQNPKPPYPPLSARLGETGKVVYKVWIGPDGKALRAEIVTSSGFARLDNAAYETVMRWRYVPGTRNGVAQTMPVNVPINWELRN